MLLSRRVAIYYGGALFITLFSYVSTGNNCDDCGVVMGLWTQTGTFDLESMGNIDTDRKIVTSWSLTQLGLGKEDPRITVEAVCHQYGEGATWNAVAIKVVQKTAVPFLRLFTIDRLVIQPECSNEALKPKIAQEIIGDEGKTAIQDVFDDKLEENYQLVFNIEGKCWQRNYKVSIISDLEVKVDREDPKSIDTNDCLRNKLPPKATTTNADFKLYGPSGTFYQVEFDESEAETAVVVKLGPKTEIRCIRTLVSKLRLIFVANLVQDKLVIDRFRVASCNSKLLEASFWVKTGMDSTTPSINIMMNDATCRSRDYRILQRNIPGNSKFSQYSVERKPVEKTNCPKDMKDKAASCVSDASRWYTLRTTFTSDPAKFVRYQWMGSNCCPTLA